MNEIGNRKSRRRPLGVGDLRKLRGLVERDGVQAAATVLGVHPQTVTTLGCGLAANNSTVSYIERRLAELDGFQNDGASVDELATAPAQKGGSK